MDEILKSVKSIEMDGLLWGAHKLIPIGYGIKKLQVGSIPCPLLRLQNGVFALTCSTLYCSLKFNQVMCTVEDDKVSIEELSEKIEEFEDFVQSCDVNAMNKI